MFVQAGMNAQKRVFDQCALVDYGVLSLLTNAANAAASPEVTEVFPDGSRACHQDLPYRPDFKFLGSLHAAARHSVQRDVSVQPRDPERRHGA